MATNERNKRKCLSLETKVMLIEEVDKKRKSKAQICRDHDIASSTLHTILKDRESIMAANASGLFQQGRKKIRKPDFEDVDRGLLAWFKQARNNNIPISGPILMEKGKELAEALGYTSFEMSIGWLNRFKTRHGIAMKVICGESASVSTDVTEAWRENELQAILRDYRPADIFNADETGLFYKCLPNRTLAEKGEACSGSKTPKDRLSLLVAANMDGSEKLPLLIIGKFAKPRCLNNIRTLPGGADYRFNKKAWMTSALFEEWVRRLDRRFLLQGRSVALIVDNCSAHPSLTDLRAIKLIFLPPNTTSVLQPCDQGIIRALKTLYRKRVLKKLIEAIEEDGSAASHLKMTVLDAICMSTAAWNEVKSETVSKCFRHAGFVINSDQAPTAADEGEQPEDVNNLFDRLRDITEVQMSAEEYIAIDDDVAPTEQATTADIARDVLEDSAAADVEEDETDTTPPVFVSSQSALQAVETLQQFCLQQPNSDVALKNLDFFFNYVEQVSNKAKKQTSITSFFAPKPTAEKPASTK